MSASGGGTFDVRASGFGRFRLGSGPNASALVDALLIMNPTINVIGFQWR
jgi:hypothetical protein